LLKIAYNDVASLLLLNLLKGLEMTETRKPSAFPHHNDANKEYNFSDEGMTLRDYFAAAALSRIMTTNAPTIAIHNEGLENYLAKKSYVMADAMMAYRSK
jgi:hypothetical protein